MTALIVAAALRRAADEPRRVAVTGDEGMVPRTWGEIAGEAARIAARLDRDGAARDVVCLIAESGAAFWAGALSVWGSGRTLLPLSRSLPPGEIARCREVADARSLLLDPACLRLDGAEADVLEGMRDGATMIDFSPSRGDEGAGLDRAQDSATLLRSSGTTGRPRLILRESASLDRVAATLMSLLELQQEDEVLSIVPMHHSYGLEHGVLAPLLAGSRVRVIQGLSPDRTLAAVTTGATVVPAVPVMLDLLAEAPRSPHRLRLVYAAGAPLPESVRVRFESRWGVAVGNLYGASEVGTISFVRNGVASRLPGVEVRICDPEASDHAGHLVECMHGARGEVCVRSDAMFRGYLARGSEGERCIDRSSIVEGFFRCGDLGAIDSKGVLRVAGRIRMQISIGGLKVDPEAVEAVLCEHPLVREALVVPLPLSETVIRLRAVVVAAGSIGEMTDEHARAIREFARTRLAGHEIPRVIEFRASLPRSAAGKLLRGEA